MKTSNERAKEFQKRLKDDGCLKMSLYFNKTDTEKLIYIKKALGLPYRQILLQGLLRMFKSAKAIEKLYDGHLEGGLGGVQNDKSPDAIPE